MPYVVFLLVLFVEPALLSAADGTSYWEVWDGAFLHAFLAALVAAVSQETIEFIRQ